MYKNSVDMHILNLKFEKLEIELILKIIEKFNSQYFELKNNFNLSKSNIN